MACFAEGNLALGFVGALTRRRGALLRGPNERCDLLLAACSRVMHNPVD